MWIEYENGFQNISTDEDDESTEDGEEIVELIALIDYGNSIMIPAARLFR